ncbi:class II glutamine amidotransferase [Bacteriovorax sp. Seq25_V]|uniref:class II glutamine amidotransferase n=1 Tax=Bacteriovorax sp. Seq25_V TaxID=1201288 RepID=UPI00038A02AE|nr:class II glutamine amidotransferase [Bacteriovorax sp. Seq25_V]EQC47307.1 glutamine amidotransferases class-II [Bacteriovorax sp. Seq25_V]
MCRLFGFRSVIQSQVHSSLVEAENALGSQSSDHPDGWGVAYYINHVPHVIKSEKTAINDSIFKRLSGIVSSQTVLAHIRKSTMGEVNILNTHPFQFGNWTFAHNGNIKNFLEKRDELVKAISPRFKRFILGSTDSEVLFYFILSYMGDEFDISDRGLKIEVVMKSVQDAFKELIKITGDVCLEKAAAPCENFLTFILTNGHVMVGLSAGKKLYYSTFKNKCRDRDTCPSYSPECEAKSETGYVNHLIFTSEPLSGENIWIEMEDYQIIGVDNHMKLNFAKVK